MWCITKNKISTITNSKNTFNTRISGRYFCNVVCCGAVGIGDGGTACGIPNACGANGIPPPPAGGMPTCIPGAAPIPGAMAGICGIAGGFGICGGVHAGPAAGAGGGGAAAGIPCAPCKSRNAEPESTRVNSPGPDAIGGGALGGNDGGVAHGEAGAGGAGANGATAAGAANGDGAAGVSGGAAASGADDVPGCASDCSNCVNPPAAAGAAAAAGVGVGVAVNGAGVIGPNELVTSGGGSFGFGSWFRA